MTPEETAAAAQVLRDAAAKAIQAQLDSSPDWAHLAEAVRLGTEHVEQVSATNGHNLSGTDKRAAAVVAIRDVWSKQLKALMRCWSGPLWVGRWAYPALALFVYPVIYRVGMWVYDQNAPRFIDILVDASKGKLKLNLDD